MIDKHIVAQKIFAYLNHSISLKELVDWCEEVMLDAEIVESDIDVVTEVAARIGVSDANNFGLLWQDCDDMLSKLGYKLHFDLLKVA